MRYMMSQRLLVLVLPVFFCTILGLALPGWGLTLDEAKAQGLVGEKANGYLGPVQPGAGPAVQDLLNDINQKRRRTYEDIARRNATSLNAVELLAGKTAIENTRPGHFVQLPSGQWLKK